MAITQEMFRFVTTRRVERAIMSRIASRLVRDRRVATRTSLLAKLFGPGLYETKLVTANTFAASADFVAADDPAVLVLEPVIAFFRRRLVSGIALAELVTEFRQTFPLLAALLEHVPPGNLVEQTNTANARFWDSFYAQTIRGFDRYVSTNYLADGIRVYHVFRLLWMSAKLGLTHWAGGAFDDYDLLIDLNAAHTAADTAPNGPGKEPHHIPKDFETLHQATEQLSSVQTASKLLDEMLRVGATRTLNVGDAHHQVLNDDAARLLSKQPALAKVDLKTTPIEHLRERLQQAHAFAAIKQEVELAELTDPGGAHALQRATAQALVAQPNTAAPAASLAYLGTPGGVFRVPLAVGAMKPPMVGDLLLVEQELRRYEEGELADNDTIMRGERRERTIRKLNRTSETTTTETSFEQEETQSLKTDERFQLATQAQQASEQSFGVQAGVSVSGKFGPVQVSASVNASFDTSKSSSESTSQEYAKTVTEEATKRVKSSFKESSSITILTETQDTSLRGFNNENGTTHVNGFYRWIDKIYDAKLLNYGRRLMLSLNVPEPAAFYRGLIQQNEAEAMAELAQPLHPVAIDRISVTPLEETEPNNGFRSYEDVDEDNYAKLAALYDVSVAPPPPEYLTGSKAFAHPDAMQATEVKEHDYANDLSYVSADNTLTVDPNYRLTHISVFAPKGSLGGFSSYVDALKLGEDGKGDENVLLVQVANRSFYLTATKNDDGNKTIVSNFNTWEEIANEYDSFGGVVQPALPVTITAHFEGILTFSVLYKAVRTDAALDAWKASTYAAIVKGYTAKKQAYDQSKAVAESKAQSATEAKTLNLRDDQYRSIELTELKRGCVDLMSEGTAAGFTSIAVAEDGTPKIVHDPAEGAPLGNWRAPLANGSVAEFFELAFEWENTTYQFHPYYWTASERWKDLAQASGADPVFEQFLRAGSASVVVPVRPGFERPVIFFLKTGLIWGGGYLALFTSPDMLDTYADVELGQQFDPPLQIGEAWEIRLPTSMVMLQEEDTLPEFPAEPTEEPPPPAEEPVPDESVPY